jgi:CheY-like chemotaxis protein
LALRERRAGVSVVACFALTVALIAGVVFEVYARTRAIRDCEARLEHTRDVTVALAGPINGLGGSGAIDHYLQNLRVVLADDPEQRASLEALEPQLTAARTAKAEPASNDASTQLAEMQQKEERRLSQEQADFQLSIDALRFSLLGLFALASGALCVFSIVTRNYIRRRGDAETLLNGACRRADAQNNLLNTSLAQARTDIRSAVTTILGYCDLPLEPQTPVQDRLASIRRQACQIMAAIKEILNAPDAAAARSDELQTAPRWSGAETLSAGSTKRLTSLRFTGRVLLAEDNPDLQKVIKFYLHTVGAEVRVVSDGQLACHDALLAWKQHNPFDLILMDVQMPRFDGRAATILLRDRGYTHPIVALTASATDEERARCLSAGCNGFLAKPVEQEAFFRVLGRYLHPAPSLSADAADAEPEDSADSQLAALRASFVAEIPTRVAEVGTAVLAGNLTRVADLTHQLKGTAGCFGLSAISAAAAALHAAAGYPESRDTINRCFQTLSEESVALTPAEAA